MKKLLVLFLAVVMLLSLAGCGAEKVVWDDLLLGAMLPVPASDKGEINSNSIEDLRVNIQDVSAKEYADYIAACKEKGFTVDGKTSASDYKAYNEEDYILTVGYNDYSEEMYVYLEAPMELTTIQWPTSNAGKLLPVPKSTIGKISYENEKGFSLYIGKTSKTDFDEYVKACADKGFAVDYSKGENYYDADNNKGWTINLRYENVGNDIMYIYIDAPDDKDGTTTTTNTTTKAASADLDPDFKKAMDSYESFMNDYVAFMKKYKNNPSDLSLISDYATYMSKYAEVASDFEEWEDEDMNAAETAYYLDVQTRVSKKLLEVAG